MSALLSAPLMVLEAHCSALHVQPIAVAISRMPAGVYVHATITDEMDASDVARSLLLDPLDGHDDLWSADALVDGQPVNFTVAFSALPSAY